MASARGAADPAARASEAQARLGGARFFRVSLLLLLLAHLAVVLSPRVLLLWNGSRARLFALEATGLLLGLCALAGCLQVAWRHLGAARRPPLRELADSALLSLLLLALGSGLVAAVRYRWASSWGTATLAPYAVSLLHGRPNTALVAQLPFLVRVHVCAAFVALAVLPFTSVGPALLLGASRALAPVARPLRAVARTAQAFADRQLGARRRWRWPEEDFGGPPPAAPDERGAGG
jgi:nitrate reductase gamma subunit